MYFVSFVLIGALVLMTLFIGVVTTSMEKASGEQEVKMAIDKRVNEVAKDAGFEGNVVHMYKECFDMIDVDVRIALRTLLPSGAPHSSHSSVYALRIAILLILSRTLVEFGNH